MFRRVNSIAYRYRVVASDPDKSQTDLSLRKRFEVNLSGRCWWQYRLQNFGNYLKLSPLFFLLQTLLPSSPSPSPLPSSHPRLLDSTHLQLRGLFLSRWGRLSKMTCITRPKFHLRRFHVHDVISFWSISRYLSIHGFFFRRPQANDCPPGFRIKASLRISESPFE